MASILLTVAGAAAGNAILPGIGGAILGGIGGALGSSVDRMLFGQTTVKGPRLDQLKVQDSSYGNGIPLIYGTVRVAGNVIWASDLIETLSTQSAGGKGFGGSQVETASYAVDCAIALGFGPLTSIRTIWADSKEVYAAGAWKAGTLWDAEFYFGTQDQIASPVMESALGAGNVPAYRGIAYVVLHRLQLGNFGNRLPNFTFEISTADNEPAPLWLGAANPQLLATPSSVHTPAGLPPLIIDSRGETATRLVIGAVTPNGDYTQYAFTAVEYNVSGDAPEELNRALSDFTALPGIEMSAVTMRASPSAKKIAFMMEFGYPNPIAMAIYDVDAQRFGALFFDTYTTYEYTREIGWLDEQHIVLGDVMSGNRGVRVYAVAGLGLSYCAFFNIWGTDSLFRLPLSSSQYAGMPGGLYAITGNVVNVPSTLYGRALAWQNNALVVGPETTLITGADTFSSMRTSIVAMNNGEVVFVRNYPGVINLFSFVPRFNGAVTTRGWTVLSVPPDGEMIVNGGGDRLYFVHQELGVTQFRIAEIGMTDTGFAITLPSTVIAGDYSIEIASYFLPLAVSPEKFFLVVAELSGAIDKAALFEKAKSAAALSAVASDLLIRAGYDEDDFDLSALDDVAVQGYSIPDPTAARAALEPLQTAYGFDLIESDELLKARLYSAAPDVTLDDAETRAAAKDDAPPPRSTVLRLQELDLPREVTVTHIDPELDYQKGTQRARRITGASRMDQSLNVPVVMSAEDAVQLAEIQLFRQWAEREQITFTLSRAYAALDPGDVVLLDGKALRLTDLRAGNGLLKIEALAVDGASLGASATAGDSGQGLSRDSGALVPSTLFIMDLPLLRLEDDQPGFYVTVSGYDGWRGAALYRSPDGVSYTVNATFTLPAVCGVAAGALPAAPADYMDRVNTVTIGLLRGEVASCAGIDLLNGANAALLGGEIIQFQNAMLNADGSYTLSNILRGRRGTEAKIASHVSGERFVMLQSETTRFLPLNLSDRGTAYDFRAASTGQEVDDVADTVFTPQMMTLAPLAPVHLCGARDASGNLSVSWKRRARKNSEWVDMIDVPLDEDVELYDMDVLSGGAVVRTFSSLTSASANYTVANQITDFGSAQASVSVNVYQLSARYGRGMAAAGSV